MRARRLVLALFAFFALVAPAQATVCELPDNGAGTVNLPPECAGGYAGHMSIINGLPPGSTIEIEAVLRGFFSIVRTPGGTLGGEIQSWSARLEMVLMGTGMLAGYSRSIVMPVEGVTQSAPRPLGRPLQSFDTDLFRLSGQVTGDPDFDLLRVSAGTNYGLPGPGHAVLTLLPSGPWNVDSFFDITYRIDFVGAPGGMLAGMSGSTTGISRYQAGETVPPPTDCILPDNGMGTANLPPDCPDGYLGDMLIRDGLPIGTTIEISAVWRYFLNVVRASGGTLGGEVQTWSAQLEMTMAGTGALAGYSRFIIIPVEGKTESAPRVLGQPVQTFDTDLSRLFGQKTGDPDFDLLRVTAGTNFGLPSPGRTILSRLPGGPWNVDSFFDITYRIDFVGAPGGPVAGMSGSTTGTDRFHAGQADPAGVEDRTLATRFTLFPCVPNPMGPSTMVSYAVPAGGGLVVVDILDVAGRAVRTLVHGYQEPGPKKVVWNGRNDAGASAASGVYYCRMRAPGFGKTLKMVVRR